MLHLLQDAAIPLAVVLVIVALVVIAGLLFGFSPELPDD